MNLREDEYKETIPTDIMLKLMKTKDQEEILKVAGSGVIVVVEDTLSIHSSCLKINHKFNVAVTSCPRHKRRGHGLHLYMGGASKSVWP